MVQPTLSSPLSVDVSGSNPLVLTLSLHLLPLFSPLQGPLLLYLVPILCATHPAPYLNVCYIVGLSYRPCHLFISFIPNLGTRLIAQPTCLASVHLFYKERERENTGFYSSPLVLLPDCIHQNRQRRQRLPKMMIIVFTGKSEYSAL